MKEYIECHEEEIHIPGHIQDYGYLIGLNERTKTIRFYSQNVPELFQVQQPLFGKSVAELPGLFNRLLHSELYSNLDNFVEKESEYFVDKIRLSGNLYHFLLYRYDGHIFLEFEKMVKSNSQKVYISNKYATPNTLQTTAEIWDNLVSSISNMIGYDRVMVYRFLDDGTGKVIAESNHSGLENFLGLHYPESDIPRQARALYLKKRERIFSNAHAEPVPILSQTADAIDLTYSSVRAMSPVHAQYIRNSGASSSFSTSIIVENRLWGLLTCQNAEPKHIDLANRIRAEVFTTLAANAYMSLKAQQKLDDLTEFNEKTRYLRNRFQEQSTLTDALFNNISVLKGIVDCDGMAIIVQDKIKTVGAVPNADSLRQIAAWHQGNQEKIYYSDSFLRDHREQFNLDASGAGVFIADLEGTKHQILMWFRREYRDYIKWAGYAEKTPGNINHYGVEKMMVSPRKSFAIYLEDIQGKSRHWQNKNIIAVEKLIPLILETSVSHSKKILHLNEELKSLNEELDSFSYTISHDLGTPLTVMKLNAQLLQNSQRSNPEVQRKLQSILHEIEGMEQMMRNVLQLSRAKSSELKTEVISTRPLIEKVVADVRLTFGSDHTIIHIDNCPDVLADHTMLTQIFQNVIGNAVKYSSKADIPTIHISGQSDGDRILYRIRDNGIGIPPHEYANLFKIFTRLDNARGFQGNGVGLSIVHRLMERLGGSITCNAEVEQGTEFVLAFPSPDKAVLSVSAIQSAEADTK